MIHSYNSYYYLYVYNEESVIIYSTYYYILLCRYAIRIVRFGLRK